MRSLIDIQELSVAELDELISVAVSIRPSISSTEKSSMSIRFLIFAVLPEADYAFEPYMVR